jgi:hypothetical protein
MKKVYVRQCERYTVWETTKPIEVDVEKLRKCEPPFEGKNEQDLLEYLNDNVWNNYEWVETNGEIYGEDASDALTLEECYDTVVYSDSRDDLAQEWLDVGVPNKKHYRMGGFEVKATSFFRSSKSNNEDFIVT